jgi:hypothetical protein
MGDYDGHPFRGNQFEAAGASEGEKPRLPTMHEMIASYRPIGTGVKPAPIERSASADFTGKMTPMGAKRAEDALNVNLSHDGRILSRRDLVRERVAAGAKIVVSQGGERRLVSLQGTYVSEKQISKTAMEYAAYLIRESGWTPAKDVTREKH